MSASGSAVSEGEAQALREQLGLDKPITVQYAKWMGLILQGNFGMAMEWGRPVSDVIGDRLALTMIISVAAIIFTWGIALPIGIYSAVYPYSFLDYAFTFIGFIGLAIPGFLLALVVMYVGFAYFGANVGGLFSPDFVEAPWSMAKVWDLIKHLPIPAIVLGVAGTAQLIRIMRSNLLDELRKPYVMTARARGLSEYRVVMRYPVRVALNPFVSTIGYLLPVRRVRKHHRIARAEPADGRSAPAQGADRPGHVPGRHHHPAAGRDDCHRYVHLGPAPHVGRSQNPVRSRVMAEHAATLEAGVVTEDRIAVATQWQLIWWRFRKHKLAVGGTIVLIAFYLVALFADFFAYADPNESEAQRSLMAPQPIHWFDEGVFRPYVFALKGTRDPRTFKRVYVPDTSTKIPVTFFGRGEPYRLLGFIPTDRHLFAVEGAKPGESLFLLGTDTHGRDLWSRLMFATRTSMTIGLVSVALSLVLGVVLGGISGYFGGAIDSAIQRVIEILRSIPTIPLWMGLAASLPADWSVVQVYFAITIIISLIGWTELARVVRGRFISLKQEDFVMAAELLGCSKSRIIFRHMVPSFISHIIAATTLAIPAIIISETSLSFLGLGLRPPAISWGVLLQDAQNIQALVISPWLLYPAIAVIIAVLAFNFMGDGIRDAADPYL